METLYRLPTSEGHALYGGEYKVSVTPLSPSAAKTKVSNARVEFRAAHAFPVFPYSVAVFTTIRRQARTVHQLSFDNPTVNDTRHNLTLPL